MLVPVIISGGAGARLRTVSREARPKPFMKVKDGLTLLQSILLRSAAIAMSAFAARDCHGPDTVLLALPANHLVRGWPAFERALKMAKVAAEGADFVTFGIVLTGPVTSYSTTPMGV